MTTRRDMLTESESRRLFAAWWSAEQRGDTSQAHSLFAMIARTAHIDPLPDSMQPTVDEARKPREDGRKRRRSNG